MAGKHSDVGARRPRRFALSALGVLALVSAGLVVGFAGTGGTYAAWNSTARVTGATVTTGSTAIQVSTTAGGFAASATLGTPTSALGPGATTATPFVVKNTGTTPVALSATVASGSSAALTSALRVAVTAASAPNCTSALAPSAVSPLTSYSTGTSLPRLQPGSTQSLCLVLTVPLNDASSATAQTVPLTVNLTGTQASS
ncbi:hypothetical protein [Gryllotalpicola koreensis]|uniref:Ribosomally synthesized peptide with SipW-like signal peptide n=1 Tax=Gryllotalpicola koreensis TaxID=993086 RepID=A0ABP8A0C2_9MICO